MKISVIIPVYNALDDLKILLESIQQNFDFTIGEVILIDDCSSTETECFLTDYVEKKSGFKLKRNQANLGFVKTCNRGLKEARGDILILLNSDTKIPSDFCKYILDCFNSDENIGVASPIGSSTALYYIEMPENYTLEQMNIKLRKKHKCVYPRIPSAEGFCFCIRRDVVEQQGYLDEIYGKGYCEETDFAYKAVINGWKNVLIDNLYVYHKRNASFGVDTRKALMKQNSVILMKRYRNFRNDYYAQTKAKNPIYAIRRELFPFKYIREFIMPKIASTIFVLRF